MWRCDFLAADALTHPVRVMHDEGRAFPAPSFNPARLATVRAVRLPASDEAGRAGRSHVNTRERKHRTDACVTMLATTDLAARRRIGCGAPAATCLVRLTCCITRHRRPPSKPCLIRLRCGARCQSQVSHGSHAVAHALRRVVPTVTWFSVQSRRVVSPRCQARPRRRSHGPIQQHDLASEPCLFLRMRPAPGPFACRWLLSTPIRLGRVRCSSSRLCCIALHILNDVRSRKLVPCPSHDVTGPATSEAP